MLRMSINPEQDVQDQLQATMAAAPPVAAYMQSVDPHASLTAPIGPAPQPAPTMAAPKQGESKMSSTATMQKPIEDKLSQRLQADYQKDADPYGSPDNHPGFFGKLLHGLNVATGGVNRRGYEEQGLENRIQGLAKNESEEGLQGAQTKKVLTDEQGDELENVNKPQQDADAHQRFQDEHQTAQNTIAQGPSLATAYAHAVNQALKENRDPATDPVVQHLQDAITSIQNQPATKGLTYETTIGADGKPHVYGLDQNGNKVADEGVHYEKPSVVNVNAGIAALDRETSRFAKPYEKGVSDANSQLEKIADARSMVNGSAEAQALGIPKVLTALVSGAGSGVRITQPELNAIAKARGLAGDVEGTLNSWAGQGKLTDTQKKQLTGILDDVKNRIEAKRDIHSQALDSINGASSREDIVKADKDARQKINDLETKGFYVGQHTPKGTIVGFNTKTGEVLIDDAH